MMENVSNEGGWVKWNWFGNKKNKKKGGISARALYLQYFFM